MKLTCDVCNNTLMMNAGGQSAICSGCGMAYPTPRLREKLGIAAQAQPAAGELIYDAPGSSMNGKHFFLIVENLFQIQGRGMVVCGTVQDAPVHLNDLVTIVRADGYRIPTQVAGIERNQTLFDKAVPSEAVGILLADTKPIHVSVGDVIAISAQAKQSPSDYYHAIHCRNCNTLLRIPAQWNAPLPNCPHCNAPF